MKKTLHHILIVAALATVFLSSQSCHRDRPVQNRFIRVQGKDLIAPNGKKFLIRGTNLGNWLNPEGYMLNFRRANSGRFINEMFCELAGPDFTAEFWKAFKDNYITRDDIRFIGQTGSNTIRLPFHYKLFTDEDYMGLTVAQDGFARIDSLINWCREAGVYIILDMHDAPGGQTGDNIDDSYGYPWLFESEASQKLYCDIWKKIAARYKNEPVILGYDLLNEPIAPYFENREELNAQLNHIYKIATKAIREVDRNHIILLGGAQWNGNFLPLTDSKFDDKLMYTCHRYGGDPTPAAIHNFIAFRDSMNLPMYMGEIGHNTNEWMAAFCKTMEDNNIGWTFWPYKKMNGSSFVSITPPAHWDTIVNFSQASRGSYQEIREARPDQSVARQAMLDFIEACKFSNNIVQTKYIQALGLQIKESLPRAVPESENILPQGITHYLDAVAKSKQDLHSLMILRHGRVVFEHWFGDHAADKLHVLHSVSKTFTAMGIGFAVAENRLQVTDKVISFFPDKLPETLSPNLEELEIRHLLTMSVGHDVAALNRVRKEESADWVQAFLAAPIERKPGSQFEYNSMATYMLSAIIQQVTGTKLVDYLYPRLFNPLGINGVIWENSPQGINAGGWGLYVKTEDMAKLGQLILQKGKWNDQQLIPESWIDEMTAVQISSLPAGAKQTDATVESENSDWLQGYGYQMWRTRHNAVRADGANGQFIIILPEKDAVIVTTANIENMRAEINLIWKYLLPAIQ